MQGLDTLKSVGGTSGGSLSQQIPQAVSQAIAPLIQNTAQEINAELVGGSGMPVPSPMLAAINANNLQAGSFSRVPASVDFTQGPTLSGGLEANSGLLRSITGSALGMSPTGNAGAQPQPIFNSYAKGGKTEAAAVQSQGRGDDTMLIHMTPGEVSGLQALAEQHGGSLTINPETGLPEAGFLKSLLPTLIGAGLMMIPGVNALGAGLITGGLQFARTGDLGQGIMAGLGAYGGANLAGGLKAAGATANPTTTTVSAAQPDLIQAGNVSADAARNLTPMETAIFNADKAAMPTASFSYAPSTAPTALQETLAGATTYTPPVSFTGNVAEAGRGISALGTETGRSAFMNEIGGGYGLATSAGSALAAPLSQPAPMPEVAEPEYNYDGPYVPSERNVRFPTADRDPADSSEFQYFDVVNPAPGFEPMASSAPLPQNTYGPDAPRFAGIPVEMATDPERMRDYQQNPDLYSFAGGGVAKPQFTQTPAPAPAAPINTAPASYRAGVDPEFNYGFQPMANVPAAQPQNQTARDIMNQIGAGTGFAATRLTGAQHEQLFRQQMAKHPTFGPQLRAAGYAEGGATEASAPPAGYVAGQDAEFDYGFRPMAAQVPEIQQEAVQVNPMVEARLGNDGGGSDYYGPGTTVNRTNRGLTAENINDLRAKAQMQRALAAAQVAQGATPSEGGNWQGNETPDGGGYETMSGAGSYTGSIDRDEAYFRAGGMTMDDGGFVIDAHTVSEIGNGSSDAGHMQLGRLGGEPIKGPGDGTSDSIKANIGGVQEARIAKDENYLSKEDVKRLGGGNLKKGEKMLYKLMAEAHKSRKNKGRGQATGLDKLIARMA